MLKSSHECQSCALVKRSELKQIRVGGKGTRILNRLQPMCARARVERIVNRTHGTFSSIGRANRAG
jgi:hypothetical protein